MSTSAVATMNVRPVVRRRARMASMLPYLLSMPALLTCIGILIPFGTAVYYSLQRYNLAFPATRKVIWFANFVSLFRDAAFWNTIEISLVYTVLTVGLEMLLGLGIALLLWRRTVVTNLLSVALILPLMVAPEIASLMWKLMTNANFGILSYFVAQLGFPNFKWGSGSGLSALFTVVLVDMWVYTPFITILLLAGLRGLPRQPFEAAELDGVPTSFVFFRIMLPMLLPYMLTAGLFRMLDSIQQFDIIYAMTQGGPGDALMVFQIEAYRQTITYTNIGRGAAILMILWAITYALSNVFMKNWLHLRERARGRA